MQERRLLFTEAYRVISPTTCKHFFIVMETNSAKLSGFLKVTQLVNVRACIRSYASNSMLFLQKFLSSILDFFNFDIINIWG